MYTLKLRHITKEYLQPILDQQRSQNKDLIIDGNLRNTFPIALDDNFCIIDIIKNVILLGYVEIPVSISKISIPYIELPVPNKKDDIMIRYISPFVKKVTLLTGSNLIDIIPIQVFYFYLEFKIQEPYI